MAEEQAQPTAEPVAEPTQMDSVPDVSAPDLGDYSFEAALENSIMAAENAESAPEAEPAAEAEPVAEAPEAPEATEATEATEPAADAEAEPAAEADSESSDLLDSLDADVGDDWTPKAATAFQRLKAELKERNAERETLTQRAREAEAKVAELEGVVGNETVETLQNKVKEYEQAQMLSNLESTDAYKDAVIQPLEEIFAGVEKLADAHGVEYQDLVDAITIEDPQAQEERVSELMATASDRDRAMFYRLAAEIDPILQRRDALHSNAAEALKEAELVAEERQKIELANRAENRRNVTQNVVQRINDKVPFLSTFEGLDMKSIESEAADVDPSVVHPVDFAYQAVAARLMPSMVKEFAAAQKTIEALTSQLASYEDAEPTLSGGSNASPLAATSSSGGDFASSIERALAGN